MNRIPQMTNTVRRIAAAAAMTLSLSPLALAQKTTMTATGVELPPFTELTLPNGGKVLLMEKHDVPLIAFATRLRGGALGDPAGKEGVASLTASLIEKGAGKRNAAEFAEAIDQVGGNLSVASVRESIIVSGNFMARDQDLMIGLLSDLLRRPLFPADEFEKVRDRSIDFIAAAKDSDLRGLIPTYFNAFLFEGNPYGRPVGGSESTLAGLKLEDVRNYYNSQFGGDRLTLALVGDFDAKQMASKIRSSFGDWKKAPSAAPKPVRMKPATGRRVLLVDKPDATQTYFWIGNVGIARNDPDRVAIDLANTAFGGRFTSMLNTELRIKSGLSYGASSQLGRETEPGAAAIASYTKTESTEKAVDLALDVLKRFRSNPLDKDTVASIKSYVLGQFPPRLETSQQLAGRLAEIAFYGLDRSDVDKYAQQVSGATSESLKRIVDRVYADPSNLTFVFIGNAGAIRDTVKKYGNVTEIKITDPRFSKSSS